MDHAPASTSDPDPVPPLEAAAEPAVAPPAQMETVESGDEETHDGEPRPVEPDAEADAGPAAASAPSAAAQGPIQDRVLLALKAHITPALPSELAATLDVPEKTLKRLLGKMTRDGSVRRAGGGRFTISRHYHA